MEERMAKGVSRVTTFHVPCAESRIQPSLYLGARFRDSGVTFETPKREKTKGSVDPVYFKTLFPLGVPILFLNLGDAKLIPCSMESPHLFLEI